MISKKKEYKLIEIYFYNSEKFEKDINIIARSSIYKPFGIAAIRLLV